MRRWVAFAISLLLPASLALADGDGPSRKMTGPEVAAFNALTGAVQEALPKTPANYTLAFSDGQQRTLFTDRAKGTPEQQTRLAALDAKDGGKAREATRDRGEKDRIRAEQKAVQKEANQLREQDPWTPIRPGSPRAARTPRCKATSSLSPRRNSPSAFSSISRRT